ncbi:HNH endonuclease signature motif containing protein [Embleya hyalina]|uniref:HNH endonuclease n=1 Tax=Embleya hyalina TaxID=516124 RepID=A0A401YYP0_9ACTN|nr:HNH endonuclease signature motif containing protein [Embleya hyalina]GCD99711.1 HNH endonuclease [Embleya hyalina]
MVLKDLTERGAVLRAIDEFDEVGQAAFLKHYEYGRSTRYFVEYRGAVYDVKALVGAAYGYQYPDRGPLTRKQFSGGQAAANAAVERLGFTVVDRHAAVSTTGTEFLARVEAVAPQRFRDRTALHRPLMLLWALKQVRENAPRRLRWIVLREALTDLGERFGNARDLNAQALYPLWALRNDGLWEVDGTEHLAPSQRPTLGDLNRDNPLTGFPAADHKLLRDEPQVLEAAIDLVLTKFFDPAPPRLSEWVRPHAPTSAVVPHGRPGVTEDARSEDLELRLALGDPNGDGPIPETDLIEYTAPDTRTDLALEHARAATRTVRVSRPDGAGGRYFETRALAVGRCTGPSPSSGDTWLLQPVPSDDPETWPPPVHELVTSSLQDTINEHLQATPSNTTNPYALLNERATQGADDRIGNTVERAVVKRARSRSARQAVLERSAGSCENPRCLGHPTELTDAGRPILEVDHIHDLARGGRDIPEVMIALCPNCHALKTRGVNRDNLTKELLHVARQRHANHLAKTPSPQDTWNEPK